jgi:hypothetical protein
MNVPDWLWQELLGEATWKAILTGSAFIAGWALKRRRAMQGKPVLVSATIQGKSTVEGTATVEQSLGTPSLARRLEEFVSWYLHVS